MKAGNRMCLLIVDADDQRAAGIEAQLRHLGRAVHTQRCEHLSQLPDEAPRFDLCVLSLDGAHTLASLGLPALREARQDCPVLVLGQPAFECSLGAILAHGFADWVGMDDPLHLRESARRELLTVQAKRQSALLRDALIDSERRVERIMHTTRDAHAVVIDGVHASANNPYLRLLSLDPERATATPFLDCVDAGERDALHALLRQYARGEASDHSRTVAYQLGAGASRKLLTHFSAWVGDGERGVLISLEASGARTDAPTARQSQPAKTDAPEETPEPQTPANLGATPDPQPEPTPTPNDVTEAKPVQQTREEADSVAPPPQAAGGLAAELDEPTSPAAEAPATRTRPRAATEPSTVAIMRKRLRHAIRHNQLNITLEALQSLEDSATHYRVRTDADDAIQGITGDDALRRLADRVGLASALDRWQLFVASRHVTQRLGTEAKTARKPLTERTATVHTTLSASALTDQTLPDWLTQLAGQYPQLRHTLWLPLRTAQAHQAETLVFRAKLDEIGMRLCLSDAFQHAGDLPALRALSPHAICMHSGVLDAWVSGKFSDENVQRLVALLRSQGTLAISGAPYTQLNRDAASRLGFCIVTLSSADEPVSA